MINKKINEKFYINRILYKMLFINQSYNCGICDYKCGSSSEKAYLKVTLIGICSKRNHNNSFLKEIIY